jgi:uncharacterized RDD family membrane protein YckC
VRQHAVITPEGVPVRFAVALAGDRVAALFLDLLLQFLVVIAIVIPLFWLAARETFSYDVVGAAALLLVFLVRAFYFSFFELAWQGQTPGKRKIGIQAVDARGGRISAEAILTRNLTREVEIFLPFIVLASPDAIYPGAPVIARLLALGWMLLFGFLPLFNRDRLRVGDLVAGTVVVKAPAAVLLDDLTTRPAPAAAVEGGYAFTDAQLDVYGEYELQILETVLREEGAAGNADAVRVVSEKIRAKIGWEGPAGDDRAFLRAFYAAQRQRLERRMLFGRRRAHKHDRR